MNDNQDNLQGPAPLPDNNEYKSPVPPTGVPASSPVPPPPPSAPPTSPPPLTAPVIQKPMSPVTPITPTPQAELMNPPNFSARTSSSIPPPPAPDIGIRTMASDLSSLKSTGGLEAKPTTFQPADFAKAPIFNPSKSTSTPGVATTVVSPTHRSRLLLIVVFSAVFIVVVGLAAYFAWQFISPTENNNSTSIVTDTTEEQVPVTTEPTITQLTHQTFFITMPTSTVTVNLAALTFSEIQTAFITALAGVQPQTLTEIKLSLNNSQVDTTAFLAVAFPELDQTVIVANFNKDMTTFVYKDANGSWPGYIFKLNDSANLPIVSTVMKGIESSSNLPNLFLTSPGASKGGFKDGLMVGETKARYITYTATGASINYAWFNNHLVVSTSFDGFKEALKLLRLPS